MINIIIIVPTYTLFSDVCVCVCLSTPPQQLTLYGGLGPYLSPIRKWNDSSDERVKEESCQLAENSGLMHTKLSG